MDESKGVDITPEQSEQGSVYKKVLEEGPKEDKPHVNDTVFIHYKGRVAGEEEVFDSSLDRGSPFKFCVGAGNVLKGWDVAVPTMNVGEKALFTLSPKFAFGSKGTKGVAPNSTVEFEVELRSYQGEDVTKAKDGGVRKSFLRRGQGFVTPRTGATMTLHLKCWHEDRLVEDKQHKFLFSKSDGGENPVLLTKGILLGVCTMRAGELARFTVQPSYAFGEQGCAELDIPAGATLVLEVRMVRFQNKRHVYEMSFEERMEGATKVKAEGTEHFKASEFADALKCYQRGVELTEGEEIFKNDENQQEMSQLRLLCLLNCAACGLKLKHWTDAREACTKGLEIDPNNVKARYRRAEASLGLNCPDESIEDLRRVLQTEPSNKSARQRLQQAEEKQKALRNKERNLYSNIFARMAEEAPEPKREPNLFDEAQVKLDAEKAVQMARMEQEEQAITASAAAIAEYSN